MRCWPATRSPTRTSRANDINAIDVSRVTTLASDDWGLQHTFELNLGRLRDGLAEQPFEPVVTEAIGRRIDALAEALGAAPKSRKWKLRARIGERKQWYEEPEEVDRGF